jgi:hypothetical protein
MGKLCILCVKSFQEERDIIYFIFDIFLIWKSCVLKQTEKGQTLLEMGVAQLGTRMV